MLREKSSKISIDRNDTTNFYSPECYLKSQLDYLPQTFTDEEYLKIITPENIRFLGKKIKLLCNRRNSVLHSLEGKTINITALSVDVVNSSVKVKTLSCEHAGEYYQIFIESISDLIESYGGYVLKNVGDCVLGFFPCGRYAVENHDRAVLCGLAASELIKHSLNPYFTAMKMPSMEVRISADFGSARVINLRSRDGYSATDLFGSALNSAAKISRYAAPNQMVVGDNLFWQLIEDDTFEFNQANRWDILGRHNYPVYVVKRSNGNCRIK